MATRHTSSSHGTLFILIVVLLVVAVAAIWAMGGPQSGSAPRALPRSTTPPFAAMIQRQLQAWNRDLARVELSFRAWERLNMRITNPTLQSDWQRLRLGFDRLVSQLTLWWHELTLWFRTTFMAPKTTPAPGSQAPRRTP